MEYYIFIETRGKNYFLPNFKPHKFKPQKLNPKFKPHKGIFQPSHIFSPKDGYDLYIHLSTSQHIAKNRRQFSSFGQKASNHLARIKSQLLDFLTTIFRANSNHGMKAKGEGMGKLKLTLELHASFVTLVGNVMVNPFTCEVAFDIDHMLKIKPSFHDLELLHDNLFFHLLDTNFSSSCASMLSKIHIFFGSFAKSGYDERVSWFPWSLCSDLLAKLKEEFVKNCDCVSSFLYASMKIFCGFISSIQLLYFKSHRLEFPHDEQKVLIIDGFLKALLLGNFHGFQFYHFHFKEFMRMPICGKKMDGSFEVLRVHLCDFVQSIFENGVFELTWKYLDEKHLVYSIYFIDYLLKVVILENIIVQNTNSLAKLLNLPFGGTLIYSLTFNEFSDELILKRELKVFHVLMINQDCSLMNSFLKSFGKILSKLFILPFSFQRNLLET
ncbi:hypothetical protein M9H77_30075 [Catharanthus roseus]|uniref:Uncharacterized protein n=1 Tax=Catharanthus roseus TaxID=4058 RepID=A0ACB9ZW79_CATRO|nr:hypothetical protein M9H77_30075 [Catharanthus roseus]